MARRSKHPEFCPGHQCPYSHQHRGCHRTPSHLWMPFPAHPGMHVGMTDIKGRKWVHHPYEGWKLDANPNRFLTPLKRRNHSWPCVIRALTRGRCKH